MSIAEGATSLALDRIALPDNVRELDCGHVAALADSIKLRGLIVPLVVRPADGDPERFVLVAGFHCHAALRTLGRTESPVLVRAGDAGDEAAARAIENIARKQLDPYQEACAVRAMLDRDQRPDHHRRRVAAPEQPSAVTLHERPQRPRLPGEIPT
jgi:ParB/RepB/Spo0J family partition protein